jgi:hypothetical protein
LKIYNCFEKPRFKGWNFLYLQGIKGRETLLDQVYRAIYSVEDEETSVLPSFAILFVQNSRLGGVMDSVFVIRPKVHGFKADRGRWIFKGDKIHSTPFLRKGCKAGDPMS